MHTRPFRTRNRLVAALLATGVCALVHVPAWTQDSGPTAQDVEPPPFATPPPATDRTIVRAALWMARNPPESDLTSPLLAVPIAHRHGVAPPIPFGTEDAERIAAIEPGLVHYFPMAGLLQPDTVGHLEPGSPWDRAMFAAVICQTETAPPNIPYDLLSPDPWLVTHTATALRWMEELGCIRNREQIRDLVNEAMLRIAADLDVTTTLGTEILAVALYVRTPLENLEQHLEALRADAQPDGSFYAPDDDTWHRTMLAWWALLEWENRNFYEMRTNGDDAYPVGLANMMHFVPWPGCVHAPSSFSDLDMSDATPRPVPQPIPIAFEGSNADPQVEASGASATPVPHNDGSGVQPAALQNNAALEAINPNDGSADTLSEVETPSPNEGSSMAPARPEPGQPAAAQPTTQRGPVGCMGR